VTLICLEGSAEMPCLKAETLEMERKGIRIETRWGPKSATSASKLSFVRCLSVLDEEGRFCPVFDDSETLELEFDQVILAVGQTVDPVLAVCLRNEFGREDRLDIDARTMQVVNRAKSFAGGDIVRGAGTVVEAVADGRRAAAGIDRFLKKGFPRAGRPHVQETVLPCSTNPSGWQEAHRRHARTSATQRIGVHEHPPGVMSRAAEGRP